MTYRRQGIGSKIKNILFSKKVFKPRSLGHLVIFLLLLLLFYLFGLFTHILEADFIEFKNSLKTDVRIAIETLKRDLKTADYMDVNQLNYNFIYNSKQTCDRFQIKIDDKKQVESNPYLVILIKSKLSHFTERNTIRKTWAQSDQMKLIRKVFLVGLPSSLEVTPSESEYLLKKLKDENKMHQDIVQQNFLDTYYNNTIKTLMGVRWIVEYCPNSKFYLFIDDDFYLNPKLLMNYLKNNVTESMMSTFYAGFVFPNSSPMRHLTSKWYISLKDYPYDKFPPYVSAGCYLLSKESARLFYIGSKLIKLFKFDDIYMGILAHRLEIKPLHLSNVYYYSPTYYPSSYAQEVIAAHGFSAEQIEDIWNQLYKMIKFETDSFNQFFKL